MLKYHIDSANGRTISGWAFLENEAPLTVEAWSGGTRVGVSQTDVPRPDVSQVFGPAASRSGFSIPLDLQTCRAPLVEVEVRFLQARRVLNPTLHDTATVRVISTAAPWDLPPSSEPNPIGIPRDVALSLAAVWPDEASSAFPARLGSILATDDAGLVGPVIAYARYLSSMWSHFQICRKYFPRHNPTSISPLDAISTPNSPEEMLAIANHLYVLKSYGVGGDFAEFGCFKGYSSAMLSYACSALGIRMHIFDSFEGLPPSSSGYQAGEFAGGLDEVRSNIQRFGAVDVVTFYKGFFSDTLPKIEMPALISLWMDVDLESSATDVMTILGHVDPRGAVFSHECGAESFGDGVSPGPRSSANVIPPIVDAIAALGDPVDGIHLSNTLGAFWRRGVSIPVLPHRDLMALISTFPR